MSKPTIIAVVDDLMFQSMLEQQVCNLGYTFVALDSEPELQDAITGEVAIAIVDLHVRRVEWQLAVSTLRDSRIPVLAFGRHTEPDLLRAARDAGCQRVVPRSQLVAALPALVADLTSV